jgi:3'(2'), 5'-bisphosphate nucleotidase
MSDRATTDARLAASLAADAAELLLGIREASDGRDPRELGRAGDRASNTLILERLAAERPADAILSEEAADDTNRLAASRVWIIDPLDGTREFTMPGRADWAVHVALWEAGSEITAAAVSLPAAGELFATDRVNPSGPGDRGPSGDSPVVLVSDSRPPPFSEAVAAAIGGRVRPMGSAGAKAMAVLRGDADAYVHAGGQWEWDSAAPVGVLLAAGFHASRIDGSRLAYNQARPYLPDLLICRPELAPPLLEALSVAAAG